SPHRREHTTGLSATGARRTIAGDGRYPNTGPAFKLVAFGELVLIQASRDHRYEFRKTGRGPGGGPGGRLRSGPLSPDMAPAPGNRTSKPASPSPIWGPYPAPGARAGQIR